MNMTVGLIFSPDMREIVLIEKKSPDWQAGYLNGVGGKSEPSDLRVRDTMNRECHEETGLLLKADEWTFFADLLVPATKVRVAFFFVATPRYNEVASMTEEVVKIYNTVLLNQLRTVPNLQWLIPLAMHWNTHIGPHRTDMVMVMEKPL